MIRFVDARHVLAVQDVDASTSYYVDVLGFRRDPIEARRWSFLSQDSIKLMLGECADDVSAADVGSHSWFVRMAWCM
jgi:catechol 2,3-dioxygenase-like lactoylglutathione lyase family enzyme